MNPPGDSVGIVLARLKYEWQIDRELASAALPQAMPS